MAAIFPVVVRNEEVRSEVPRFKYQAAESQRRDLFVKRFGNAPNGVFGCTVKSGSSHTTVGRGATGSVLNFPLFVWRTDLYPASDPIQTITPALRGRK